jgi:hypothetical protein
MTSQSITERKIQLTLTEKEAFLLKAMCQNYLGQEEEPPESYDIRLKVFDELSVCLMKGE